MQRHAPKMRLFAWACGWGTGLLILSGALPIPAWRALIDSFLNPLLVFQCVVTLALGLAMLLRGSRHAVIFMVGWTPLIVLIVMDALQTFGMLSQFTSVPDATLMANAVESVVLLLGLADRATTLRRDRDEARRQADIDPLTETLNRRAWTHSLQTLLEDAQRLPLNVLFIDLDNFKQLNDRHGHEVGDQALLALVKQLRAGLRDMDILGRYGGEEFVVALPGCNNGRALQLAERLRKRIEHLQWRADPHDTQMTISIGIAGAQPGDDATALTARADLAMYAAKNAGRNRIAHSAMTAGA
jgi:diguanylate cyclase (GGDEF)-like protein